MKHFSAIAIASLSSFLIIPAACSQLSSAIDRPVNSASIAKTLSSQQIQQLATNITVKIFNTNNQGSGVIIAKDGQTYTVVTNAHVIKNQQTYQIQTPDGQLHQTKIISRGNSLEGNDLAFLEFSASETYQVISLSPNPNIKENQSVYASGFPEETTGLAINPGKISLISSKPFIGGYQIGYTNEIKLGMSGGPLLNQNGELIGINGLRSHPVLNSAYAYQDGSKPTEERIERFREVSFAIPVKTLVLVAPNLAVIPKESTTGISIFEKVDRIAQQITVRIDSNNNGNGSGAIIGKQRQTYYVVTAAHVVENPDQYQIVAPDGEKYPLKIENILTSSGLDVALIKFNSSKKYQVASIGRYDIPYLKKQSVFVSGFPGSLNGIRKLTFGFRFSREGGLLFTTDHSTLDISNTGYELIYTNRTQPGMSGGPVLDGNGQVIGINAGVEGEYLTSEYVIQIGYAFGVPASNFLGLATKKRIPSEALNIITTAPKQLTQAEVASLKTHPSFTVEKPLRKAKASSWLTYGNQLWRWQQFKEAISALQKAIAIEPELYQAYYALGLVYSSEGKYQEALQQFDKVIKLKPNYYQAWREQSEILSKLEKYQDALIAINKAIEDSDGDLDLYYLRSVVYIRQKKWELAIADYNKAIQINPHYGIAYNNRGVVYDNQKKWELAITDYNKAIQINPDDAVAYNNRGGVYSDQKKWELALADLNKAIQINPNYADAYTNRGNVYYKQDKWQSALADYNKAIEINPNFAKVYNDRGLVYYQQDKWELAIADYNKAIQIDSNYAVAYYNRGLVYYQQDKWELALADRSKAIQINPNYAKAYSDRANIYKNQQKWELALADLNKAILIDPDDAIAYNNRGLVYSEQKKWELALADFNKAIPIDPNYAEAYNNRGNVYNNQKKWELALADYSKAIQINPDDAVAYNNRGVVYKNQQKWELALADLNKAVQINPNYAEAYNNRANIYKNQKKWELALADFNKAILIDPNFAIAYNNRGIVYKNQKKWELALADLNKAVSIDPNLAHAYANRGLVWIQLGDKQKALNDLQTAAQLFQKLGNMALYRQIMNTIAQLQQ